MDPEEDRHEEKDHTGTALGMPYDWNKPTAARAKSRFWNPDERRLFPPKAFGWGYAINFYELFRRMRLIRR